MKLLCYIQHLHGFKRGDRQAGQAHPSSSLSYLPEALENRQVVTAAHEQRVYPYSQKQRAGKNWKRASQTARGPWASLSQSPSPLVLTRWTTIHKTHYSFLPSHISEGLELGRAKVGSKQKIDLLHYSFINLLLEHLLCAKLSAGSQDHTVSGEGRIGRVSFSWSLCPVEKMDIIF